MFKKLMNIFRKKGGKKEVDDVKSLIKKMLNGEQLTEEELAKLKEYSASESEEPENKEGDPNPSEEPNEESSNEETPPTEGTETPNEEPENPDEQPPLEEPQTEDEAPAVPNNGEEEQPIPETPPVQEPIQNSVEQETIAELKLMVKKLGEQVQEVRMLVVENTKKPEQATKPSETKITDPYSNKFFDF